MNVPDFSSWSFDKLFALLLLAGLWTRKKQRPHARIIRLLRWMAESPTAVPTKVWDRLCEDLIPELNSPQVGRIVARCRGAQSSAESGEEKAAIWELTYAAAMVRRLARKDRQRGDRSRPNRDNNDS